MSLSERSMRAITDNIPALIAHVDNEQRYTFVNAFVGRVFGVAPETMIGKTIREVRGEKLYAELDHLARIDGLSGVANRRYFEEHLAEALARSRRQVTALALLCVDIDHFKAINDKHGHPVGDAVIVAFAEKLESCVRERIEISHAGDGLVIRIHIHAEAHQTRRRGKPRETRTYHAIHQ